MRIVRVKGTVCLVLITALCSTLGVTAQTVPDPPKPPKTSLGTSYSISIENDDDDDDEEHSSSVSISISDDAYKFRARYHNSKHQGIKALLQESLGKDNFNINGKAYLWSNSQNGDEVFECKLTKGHLRMYVDAKVASQGFVENISKLGNDLKYFISCTDPKEEKTKAKEKAKRDMERAKRELENAKRELERAEREAKGGTRNN